MSKGDRRRTPPLEHEANDSREQSVGQTERTGERKKQLAAKSDERQPNRRKIKDKEADG